LSRVHFYASWYINNQELAMDLYCSPLSCSLATRIALYEAALEHETTFHHVTLETKRYDDGADLWQVTGKGQVPALITRDGTLLTENAAVLQYVADLAPTTGLAPPASAPARYLLQQWLSYIATELHKQVFAVVFNPGPPPEAAAYALGSVLPARLDFVDNALVDRPFLVGDTFTVADAYLATVLNWCGSPKVGLALARWPSIAAYQARMLARPQVQRALREELALWRRA
jgi:glutathione S-transferase